MQSRATFSPTWAYHCRSNVSQCGTSALVDLSDGLITPDQRNRAFGFLVRMEEEETAITVLEVDYESVAVLDRDADGARVEVDWSVGGVVTHRGHNHPRVNRYRAVYTLSPLAGISPPTVRIVDTRMKDLSRVRSDLSGRSGWSLDETQRSAAGRMDPSALLRAGMDTELVLPADEEAEEAP